MKKALGALYGKQMRFRMVFERYGARGATNNTLLFVDVQRVDTGAFVADHLWFPSTKEFKKHDLKQGDLIELTGLVCIYTKGLGEWKRNTYYPVSADYKIDCLTDIVKTGRREVRKRVVKRSDVKPYHFQTV